MYYSTLPFLLQDHRSLSLLVVRWADRKWRSSRLHLSRHHRCPEPWLRRCGSPLSSRSTCNSCSNRGLSSSLRPFCTHIRLCSRRDRFRSTRMYYSTLPFLLQDHRSLSLLVVRWADRKWRSRRLSPNRLLHCREPLLQMYARLRNNRSMGIQCKVLHRPILPNLFSVRIALFHHLDRFRSSWMCCCLPLSFPPFHSFSLLMAEYWGLESQNSTHLLQRCTVRLEQQLSRNTSYYAWDY